MPLCTSDSSRGVPRDGEQGRGASSSLVAKVRKLPMYRTINMSWRVEAVLGRSLRSLQAFLNHASCICLRSILAARRAGTMVRVARNIRARLIVTPRSTRIFLSKIDNDFYDAKAEHFRYDRGARSRLDSRPHVPRENERSFQRTAMRFTTVHGFDNCEDFGPVERGSTRNFDRGKNFWRAETGME